MMAQRVVFTRPGVAELETFDVPAPANGEVSVRALYSLMSIGTELTILHQRYSPDSHFARRFKFPQLKTGVQCVAEIESVGEGVTEFRPGERIFMRMAHCSRWTLPAIACSPVPRAADPRSACWAGLAKTAFRAAFAAKFALGGNVLIVGAGPVGQMLVRWANAAGMSDIVVVDQSQRRLRLAAQGACCRTVCGSIEDAKGQLLAGSGANGFDIVVDTTGNATVFHAALPMVANFGCCVLLGDTGYPEKQHLSSEVMTRGLTIVATHDHHDRGGWTQRAIDRVFFKLLLDGRFSVDDLITHEFPPTRCAEAYALADQHRQDVLGIVFDWTAFEGG
ncbi:MAG: zinc-binding dehydrogenase [Steroidobacteraceae bacterium]